jgi:adenylate cyclase
MSSDKGLFFKKVRGTRVFPVALKIIIIFIVFILVSNFATNYINLMLGRNAQLKLSYQLIAKDLKDVYSFANTQYEIFQYNRDKKGSYENIKQKALFDLKGKAVVVCFGQDGEVYSAASKMQRESYAIDKDSLKRFNESLEKNKTEDKVSVHIGGDEYLGVYKWNDKWKMYILRGEQSGEFYAESRNNFIFVSVVILVISILCLFVGIYVLRRILRYIGILSNSIMEMIKHQQITTVSLKGAPNDDITYLGIAFNSLANTIDTLMNIFRKFANKDVVIKAYKDKEILLEGSRKELAILFSDIKGFTFITETLGTDIIKLINLHYDKSIREIVNYDGVIGSIIGDALLAVFGTMEDSSEYNKSYASIMSAYKLQAIASTLRDQMTKKRNEIIRKRGKMSVEEERVYQSVLIEIGVGIDGGEVFYGNIGSYVRMTNTVIGDNVNSASRLEGLTRVYSVPVICSEYIKDDVEKNVKNSDIQFIEIDTVQVKGKTQGKKIFWPIKNSDMTPKMKKEIHLFTAALMEYYDGSWKKAASLFRKSDLPLAGVFIDRTKGSCPRDWKGVWAMTSK